MPRDLFGGGDGHAAVLSYWITLAGGIRTDPETRFAESGKCLRNDHPLGLTEVGVGKMADPCKAGRLARP